jgi:hypothetical protein
VELQLVVRSREQPEQPLTAFELAHERLMHLIMVRRDLTQFTHEHPSFTDDGMFRLRHIFLTAGEYHLFADVAPKGAGSQVLLAKLHVSGKRTQAWDISSTTMSDRGLVRTIGNIQIQLRCLSHPYPLRSRTSERLGVVIQNTASGSPVTDLEPYLGARGHLLLIHQDATTFVHSHPVEEPRDRNRLKRDLALDFLVRLPKSGLYRAWLQFQRNNVVATYDFILEAQ